MIGLLLYINRCLYIVIWIVLRNLPKSSACSAIRAALASSWNAARGLSRSATSPAQPIYRLLSSAITSACSAPLGLSALSARGGLSCTPCPTTTSTASSPICWSIYPSLTPTMRRARCRVAATIARRCRLTIPVTARPLSRFSSSMRRCLRSKERPGWSAVRSPFRQMHWTFLAMRRPTP